MVRVLDAPARTVPMVARPAARVIPISSHRSWAGGPRAASAAPRDIDWSRVMAAVERMSLGFYDRPDVRGRIADAVLRDLRP